jgi:hypothetical protein
MEREALAEMMETAFLTQSGRELARSVLLGNGDEKRHEKEDVGHHRLLVTI